MHSPKRHPGQQLAKLMIARSNMSANALAELSGISQPTITRILNGTVKNPDNDTLDKIARALGVSLSTLRDEDPLGAEATLARYTVVPPPRVVPVISPNLVGRERPLPASTAYTEVERIVYTTHDIGIRAYAMRLRGDSMENPVGGHMFPEGAIVIVDPDRPAQIGDFVAARPAGTAEATFKQLVEDAGRRYLKPLNPRYPMLPLDQADTLCGTWIQTIIDSEE